MSAETSTRVERQTAPRVNQRIRKRGAMSVAYYAAHPGEVDQRLRELDREWDIERALETVSSSLSLAGLTAGVLGRKRWLLLPVVVQGFFLQHALSGWCPPLPLLRAAGFRTAREIEDERHALLALRGSAPGSLGATGSEAHGAAPPIERDPAQTRLGLS